MYRGGGSIGLIGAARSGLLVGTDPNDDSGSRRVLAHVKGNLAAPVPSLAFVLEALLAWSIGEWLGYATARRPRSLTVAPEQPESHLSAKTSAKPSGKQTGPPG